MDTDNNVVKVVGGGVRWSGTYVIMSTIYKNSGEEKKNAHMEIRTLSK